MSAEHSIPVRAIWLRREGDEDDPLAVAVVEVELEDGHSYEVIRELVGSNFSHCVTSYGIESKQRDNGAVKVGDA